MSKDSHKILLVEDDQFLAEIYTKKLGDEGFQVSAAGDGEEGLKMMKRKKPDLVLLDILLPKKDGFAVLAEMKKDPELKTIPVIMLTNLGQRDDVEKGLELGANDYLIKAHFSPQETVERIRKVLAGAKEEGR